MLTDLAFPLVLLVSEMKANALTRMERKVKGGGSSESLSKNWIPVLARAYLEVGMKGKTRNLTRKLEMSIISREELYMYRDM